MQAFVLFCLFLFVCCDCLLVSWATSFDKLLNVWISTLGGWMVRASFPTQWHRYRGIQKITKNQGKLKQLEKEDQLGEKKREKREKSGRRAKIEKVLLLCPSWWIGLAMLPWRHYCHPPPLISLWVWIYGDRRMSAPAICYYC